MNRFCRAVSISAGILLAAMSIGQNQATYRWGRLGAAQWTTPAFSSDGNYLVFAGGTIVDAQTGLVKKFGRLNPGQKFATGPENTLWMLSADEVSMIARKYEIPSIDGFEKVRFPFPGTNLFDYRLNLSFDGAFFTIDGVLFDATTYQEVNTLGNIRQYYTQFGRAGNAICRYRDPVSGSDYVSEVRVSDGTVLRNFNEPGVSSAPLSVLNATGTDTWILDNRVYSYEDNKGISYGSGGYSSRAIKWDQRGRWLHAQRFYIEQNLFKDEIYRFGEWSTPTLVSPGLFSNANANVIFSPAKDEALCMWSDSGYSGVYNINDGVQKAPITRWHTLNLAVGTDHDGLHFWNDP